MPAHTQVTVGLPIQREPQDDGDDDDCDGSAASKKSLFRLQLGLGQQFRVHPSPADGPASGAGLAPAGGRDMHYAPRRRGRALLSDCPPFGRVDRGRRRNGGGRR